MKHYIYTRDVRPAPFFARDGQVFPDSTIREYLKGAE